MEQQRVSDHRTLKLLLKVLASPAAVLTEGQMLGVLELSGIVGNPTALKALQFAEAQASASAPTTLVGFASTLQNLIKVNPDHNPADYANLEAYVKQITSTGTDVPLTFGMFLSLLDAIPNKPFVPVKPPASASRPTAVKRRARRKAKKVSA